MRRALPAALIAFLITLPATAQRGGGGHAGGGGARSGGVARSGAMRGGSFSHSGSYYHGSGYNRRSGFRFYGYNGIYPFYYGGLGYYDPYWDYSNTYPDTSDYNYPPADYGYAAPQAPPVIVNQEFQTGPPPQPVVREYTAPGPPAPAAPAAAAQQYEQPLYLVAFHGGDIRAVLAYWVQGTSLHYVTMDHEQKQVTLTSVDRALSERLNGERNVPFQLPR